MLRAAVDVLRGRAAPPACVCPFRCRWRGCDECHAPGAHGQPLVRALDRLVHRKFVKAAQPLSRDDAWRSSPVMADDKPYSEVEYALSQHNLNNEQAVLLRSTSWRVDGPIILLAYIAVIRVTDLDRATWPSAFR